MQSSSSFSGRSRILRAFAVIIILAGAGLAAAGIWLAGLGGSPYYLTAGLFIVATGALLFARRLLALPVYAAVLLGTAAWACWEVGPELWLLMPRLLAPLGLGVVIGLPWVWRHLDAGGRRTAMTADADSATRRLHAARWPVASLWIAVLATALVGGLAALHDHSVHGVWQGTQDANAASDTSVADSEWRFYGRTPRGDRFSPLADITPATSPACARRGSPGRAT